MGEISFHPTLGMRMDNLHLEVSENKSLEPRTFGIYVTRALQPGEDNELSDSDRLAIQKLFEQQLPEKLLVNNAKFEMTETEGAVQLWDVHFTIAAKEETT